MQQDGFYVGGDNKLEISIPIFLQPLMSEILSIGKSIKIIRFMETNLKIDKTLPSLYQERIDFKSLYALKK